MTLISSSSSFDTYNVLWLKLTTRSYYEYVDKCLVKASTSQTTSHNGNCIKISTEFIYLNYEMGTSWEGLAKDLGVVFDQQIMCK